MILESIEEMANWVESMEICASTMPVTGGAKVWIGYLLKGEKELFLG